MDGWKFIRYTDRQRGRVAGRGEERGKKEEMQVNREGSDRGRLSLSLSLILRSYKLDADSNNVKARLH